MPPIYEIETHQIRGNKNMKETFRSKLRELLAIRRRCHHIQLEQQRNRLPQSSKFYIELRRLSKIRLLKMRRVGTRLTYQ